MQGNKILEIKNPNISKGQAAQDWLKRDYDFVLSFGDDKTDEELFAVLPETAYSIKVGRGRTRAQYRLGNYREVRKLLQRLARN
jgi:trehalose 6-phosphate synthase/phosphatase